MALTVTVNSMVDRVRKITDTETADQSKSIVSDAEIIEYLNDGYRELYELIADEAGPEMFEATSTLSSPSYSFPSDFYQLIGVDYTPSGASRPISLNALTPGSRNAQVGSTSAPYYRIRAGALTFQPTDFVGSVTLRYVPAAATLAAGGSFNSVDGWDVYVINHAGMQVRRKQEYDVRDFEMAVGRAERRVRRAAARLAPDARGILDVRTLPDAYFYND